MSFRFSLEGFGHEEILLWWPWMILRKEMPKEIHLLLVGDAWGMEIKMECGSEGHTPLLGWMVEFDTNVNAWDPTEGNHVFAFCISKVQGEQDSHIFWTDIEEIQDNGWHEVNEKMTCFSFGRDISNNWMVFFS